MIKLTLEMLPFDLGHLSLVLQRLEPLLSVVLLRRDLLASESFKFLLFRQLFKSKSLLLFLLPLNSFLLLFLESFLFLFLSLLKLLFLGLFLDFFKFLGFVKLESMRFLNLEFFGSLCIYWTQECFDTFLHHSSSNDLLSQFFNCQQWTCLSPLAITLAPHVQVYSHSLETILCVGVFVAACRDQGLGVLFGVK